MKQRERWAVMPAWMVDERLMALDGSTIKVYLYLSRWANKDGQLWHSQERMAAACGLSKRTVVRAMKTLEDMHAIVCTKRGTTTNLYSLGTIGRRPGGEDTHVTTESVTDPGKPLLSDTHVTHEVTPMSLSVVTPMSPKVTTSEVTIKEVTTNPSSQPPSPPEGDEEFVEYLKGLGDPKLQPGQPRWLGAAGFEKAQQLGKLHGYDHLAAITRYEQAVAAGWSAGEPPNEERFTSAWLMLEKAAATDARPLPGVPITVDSMETLRQTFDRFWAAYPKQQNQNEAIDAYKIAVQKVNPAILISKAQGYARLVKRDRTEGQYVKYAHNWLAEERWNDTYPSALPSMSHTAADD